MWRPHQYGAHSAQMHPSSYTPPICSERNILRDFQNRFSQNRKTGFTKETRFWKPLVCNANLSLDCMRTIFRRVTLWSVEQHFHDILQIHPLVIPRFVAEFYGAPLVPVQQIFLIWWGGGHQILCGCHHIGLISGGHQIKKISCIQRVSLSGGHHIWYLIRNICCTGTSGAP